MGKVLETRLQCVPYFSGLAQYKHSVKVTYTSYVEALETPPDRENQQIKNVQPQIDLWFIEIKWSRASEGSD